MEFPTIQKSQNSPFQTLILKPSWKERVLGIVFLIFVGWDIYRQVAPHFLSPGTRPIQIQDVLSFALSLGFLYMVLALAFNSRRIEAGSGKLKVRIRPFPFFGKKDFETGRIQKVFLKETSLGVDVRILETSGADHPVIQSLRPHDAATQVKVWIESALGLPASN